MEDEEEALRKKKYHFVVEEGKIVHGSNTNASEIQVLGRQWFKVEFQSTN